ncbi:hypothetical protein H257_07536 [Aphanomyces astaci]|uniref:Uncharacterized protein n=1 Tax=Aphanomyces astaci TaxID=112090 RepID=W4GG67_APHAT|nr:hypothetical protein H257_07536 [Aphanomyces astaci]ETV78682.1 hypothetical protein H257_07536 [Aphanomyces astaci]|eukprot:XP_009831401.1 hypothetical protein H257_07536 [Aphanomyces astaci]
MVARPPRCAKAIPIDQSSLSLSGSCVLKCTSVAGWQHHVDTEVTGPMIFWSKAWKVCWRGGERTKPYLSKADSWNSTLKHLRVSCLTSPPVVACACMRSFSLFAASIAACM